MGVVSNAIPIISLAAAEHLDLLKMHPDVDRGEAETIVLGIEEKADLLLIDETVGRAVAKHLGHTLTGTPGVLIVAKRRGAISNVKPVIDDIVSKGKFFAAPRLIQRVLVEAGE